MASAWGKSFGVAWGNSWGSIAAPVAVTYSGGYERVHDYPGRYAPKRRTRAEIDEERRRYGITIQAAIVIERVAEAQVDNLSLDNERRLEELKHELRLENIAWRGVYLKVLEAERERLIREEIAARLREYQDDEDAVKFLFLDSL